MSFRLVHSTEVPDYSGTAFLYEHEGTGAQVFHVYNDDPENLFAFAFKTLPPDSTGVAHILEHTVLSGSQRFPVKDPFLHLLKGSANTFLNAMTYPDKTVYPAASPIKRDLFNLMRVYGDAVFFPLLKRELFDQEGHRLQFDGEGVLERSGIVFNEMKGSYSSHDSIAAERCYQSLFPNTLYRFDSGGDPEHIPDLSYEAFLEFHRRFYHPSNAFIVLYGDTPSEEYFHLLEDEFLCRFDRQRVDAEVPLQPRWNEPRALVANYPIPRDADSGAATSVTMNWLLTPVTDVDALLQTAVMTEILIGHSGSPLQKALIDSGLGDDLSPVLGLESNLREVVFSAGLRGTEPDRAEEMEAIVFDTLRGLVEGGIDADTREGALRTIEFRNRELKSGPNGMRVMGRVLKSWIHGGHPAEPLAFSKRMATLRSRLEHNPSLFEEMIDRLLVNNAHRSTVTVAPAPGLAEDTERERAAELALMLDEMDEPRRREVQSAQEALERLQRLPDDPEAVKRIPTLELDDIPREIVRTDVEITTLPRGVPAYRHSFHTNGIVYVDFAFDLSGLPREWESFLNLFASAFTEVGIPGLRFDEFQRRLALDTGGITTFVSNQFRSDEEARVQGLFTVRVRLLESQLAQGIGLFERLLCGVDFADTARLSQVLDEIYTELRAALIPSGHYFAGVRAAAALSPLGVLEDRIGGIGQYTFLQGLHEDDKAALDLAPHLAEMAHWIVVLSRLAVNITADSTVMDTVTHRVSAVVERLGERRGKGLAIERLRGDVLPSPDGNRSPELLLTSAGVSHVALALAGRGLFEEGYAAQEVLAHVLRTGELWERIRMAGGAYGAFCNSKTMERLFAFGSYRDPRSVETLDAFRAALEATVSNGIDRRGLDLALISILGRELRPMVPRERGFIDFRRRIHGTTDEMRQRIRDDLRATTPDSIRSAAAWLLNGIDGGAVVTLGGDAARRQMSRRFTGLVCTELGI